MIPRLWYHLEAWAIALIWTPKRAKPLPLGILQDTFMEPLNIEVDLQHPNIDMRFRNAFRYLGTLKTRAISLVYVPNEQERYWWGILQDISMVPSPSTLNIEFELLHPFVRLRGRNTSRQLNELWFLLIALNWSPNEQELCLWECIYFVLQQITEFDLSSSSSQKQQ